MPFVSQPHGASGEVAPEIGGRYDLDWFYTALKTCRNAIVRKHGGIDNRPGSIVVGEQRYGSAYKTRLIPFRKSRSVQCLMEIGNGYMRIVRNGGYVTESAKVITGATNANPCVITCAAHGYSNGESVYISGVVGMTEVNNRIFKIAASTTNTFALTDAIGTNINSASYASYISGGTVARIYTLGAPWAEGDLPDISSVQDNDVVTLCHLSHMPRDVTRYADSSWTISPFDNHQGPFHDVNSDTTKTIYASGATGSVTLTANFSLFTASMVGELFYLEQMPGASNTPKWEVGQSIAAVGTLINSGAHYYHSATTGTTGTVKPTIQDGSEYDGTTGVKWNYLHSGFGVALITSIIDAQNAVATVVTHLPIVVGAPNATHIWAVSAWGVTNGYPRCATYHDGRLIFAGTKAKPQTCWASATNARTFFGKSNPLLDDEAMTFDIASDQTSPIKRMVKSKDFIVMTEGEEITIKGREDSLLATQTPIRKIQSRVGVGGPPPVVVDDLFLFVDGKSDTIRSFGYRFENDSYVPSNLSPRSWHLLKGKTVSAMAWQGDMAVLWVVLDDGSLVGLTFNPENQVIGWHRHDTDGFYEDVACIEEDGRDVVYASVRRLAGGAYRRFLECFVSRDLPADPRDMIFLDATRSFDGRNAGSTTLTLSGGSSWDHPETLTLTASASLFKASDLGDAIHFWSGDSCLKLAIIDYTSATQVSVQPNHTVPVTHRSSARTDWEFARRVLSGLEHLEGASVGILADGHVIPSQTVSGGSVTLAAPAAVVHVGRPYVTDIESLDISTLQVRGDLASRQVNVTELLVHVQDTRGLKIGTKESDLQEYVADPDAPIQDAPAALVSGKINMIAQAGWSMGKRVFIRQDQPLPLSLMGFFADVKPGR